MPYVGARYPESIDIRVPTQGGFDMTTVTSVEIMTRSPKKVALTWVWTIGPQTSTELHLLHAFSADGNDAREEGQYIVSGWLVSPGTRRRIKPLSIPFEKYG